MFKFSEKKEGYWAEKIEKKLGARKKKILRNEVIKKMKNSMENLKDKQAFWVKNHAGGFDSQF